MPKAQPKIGIKPMAHLARLTPTPLVQGMQSESNEGAVGTGGVVTRAVWPGPLSSGMLSPL